MNAYIKGLSYFLPERVMTNEDLVNEFPEWNVEKVAAKTGIRSRHLATADQTAGDLALSAARKLFEEYSVTPQEIDFILLCTQSPDYFLPTTACILQHQLGIPTACGALDFNLGCSGYVYGLALAKGLILSGTATNVLLLTAETYNKHIHPLDKGNRSLFGDAAAATLVSTDGLARIGDFVLGTDGSGAGKLIVKTGAFRNKERLDDLGKDEAGYLLSSDHLYMNGPEIFSFTLETVPPLIAGVLEKNHLKPEEVGLYVFHQANQFMLNTLRKVCGIPKEKFYIHMEKTGNTVSSTLPIAFKELLDNRQIPSGTRVMTAGFGVGLSWGGTVLTF